MALVAASPTSSGTPMNRAMNQNRVAQVPFNSFTPNSMGLNTHRIMGSQPPRPATPSSIKSKVF